jgi:hypothetical protein
LTLTIGAATNKTERTMPRLQKITFGEMRASGASRVIVHCGDDKCGHSVTLYPAL